MQYSAGWLVVWSRWTMHGRVRTQKIYSYIAICSVAMRLFIRFSLKIWLKLVC